MEEEHLIYRHNSLLIDIDSHTIVNGKKECSLKYEKSWEILELLVQNGTRTLTHETIIEKLWGHELQQPPKKNLLNSIHVYIRDIRSTIGDPGSRIIGTRPNKGYYLIHPTDSVCEADKAPADAVKDPSDAQPVTKQKPISLPFKKWLILDTEYNKSILDKSINSHRQCPLEYFTFVSDRQSTIDNLISTYPSILSYRVDSDAYMSEYDLDLLLSVAQIIIRNISEIDLAISYLPYIFALSIIDYKYRILSMDIFETLYNKCPWIMDDFLVHDDSL